MKQLVQVTPHGDLVYLLSPPFIALVGSAQHPVQSAPVQQVQKCIVAHENG